MTISLCLTFTHQMNGRISSQQGTSLPKILRMEDFVHECGAHRVLLEGSNARQAVPPPARHIGDREASRWDTSRRCYKTLNQRLERTSLKIFSGHPIDQHLSPIRCTDKKESLLLAFLTYQSPVNAFRATNSLPMSLLMHVWTPPASFKKQQGKRTVT